MVEFVERSWKNGSRAVPNTIASPSFVLTMSPLQLPDLIVVPITPSS
jgi:hypothetical protein